MPRWTRSRAAACAWRTTTAPWSGPTSAGFRAARRPSPGSRIRRATFFRCFGNDAQTRLPHRVRPAGGRARISSFRRKETLMARYVDGFVVPVPKDKLDAYRQLAEEAGRIWKEHGALEFVEAVADDVKPGE